MGNDMGVVQAARVGSREKSKKSALEPAGISPTAYCRQKRSPIFTHMCPLPPPLPCATRTGAAMFEMSHTVQPAPPSLWGRKMYPRWNAEMRAPLGM